MGNDEQSPNATTAKESNKQQDRKGLLISFDGLDSTGKETQVNRFVDRLRYAGFRVLHLQSPDYNTPSGQELKRKIQNKDGEWEATPWREKLKYFADNRAEHKQEVIDALNKGDIVVYDRYIPSSLAFIAVEAFGEEGRSEKTRKQVHEAIETEEYEIHGMPKEDVSIFLDVPPRVAVDLLTKRKENLQDDDEYTDHISVQESLYNEYDNMCTSDKKRFLRIRCMSDGMLLEVEAITEIIWDGLVQRFDKLKTT